MIQNSRRVICTRVERRGRYRDGSRLEQVRRLLKLVAGTSCQLVLADLWQTEIIESGVNVRVTTGRTPFSLLLRKQLVIL